jgi:hypothetical protein
MPKKKLNPVSNWRCRREEYLRATARRDDLISEGYEPVPPSAEWTVLLGGRHRNHDRRSGAIRLCLVKEAKS